MIRYTWGKAITETSCVSLYSSYCMMRSQDVCVPCLKCRSSCGLKLCADVKPKAAPCGKLIFLLAVYGVAWYPDKPALKKAARQSTLAALQHGKTSKKRAAIFFIKRPELDKQHFLCPIPIKCTYVTFKKDIPKPFIHSVIDWPAPRLPSPHLILTCSPLFIPLCLCVSVWMCVCSALSSHLERHQSDSPIPSKRPSSRSETSENPLSSKRPRTAEKNAAEQVSCNPKDFVHTDAFRCSSNSLN